MSETRLALKKSENRVAGLLNDLRCKNKSVILYGAGCCGNETIAQLRKHNIDITAVCDDNRVGEMISGIKITDISQIRADDDTILLVTAGFKDAMVKKIYSLGLFGHYVDIDFGRYDENKENYDYFMKHLDSLETVYSLLSDQRSKDIFQSLINYRISRDLGFLSQLEEHDQYFPHEERLNLKSDHHVFCDFGAFDGDTIGEFLKYVRGNYEKIIAVEVNDRNFDRLVSRHGMLRNIEFHKIGVYRERAKIPFIFDWSAKSSFATEDGESYVDVDSLDNILLGQKPTFIKMDIEGAEYDALIGGEQTISHCLPFMAICIYHKVEDLYRIPMKIEELCPRKYDYFIRHYSPTVIETVFYAVPKNS